jgi:hypothetical protein
MFKGRKLSALAEFFGPFGTYRIPVQKVGATSPRKFEDEDDDEYENDKQRRTPNAKR